jgi:hypothetical protein
MSGSGGEECLKEIIDPGLVNPAKNMLSLR